MRGTLIITLLILFCDYCHAQNENNDSTSLFFLYCDRFKATDFSEIDKKEFIEKIDTQRKMLDKFVANSIQKKYNIIEQNKNEKYLNIEKCNSRYSMCFGYRFHLINDTIVDYAFKYPISEYNDRINELDVEMFSRLAKFDANFYELKDIGSYIFKIGNKLPMRYTIFFSNYEICEKNKEYLINSFYGYDEDFFNYDLKCTNDAIARFRFYTQVYRDSSYFETAQIYLDIERQTGIIKAFKAEKEWEEK